ncbi:MAG TPA: sulfite exporter TauE/SafE family protein [Acidimicrobiia bacterium]|nr:sulfite exporter TauE/SafE family protein [Acidimicrobiia bacterium]
MAPRRVRSSTGLLVLTTVALALMTGTARAHPLGNFTTNVHLGLLFSPGWLDLSLVVDMAEIPAFREKRAMDQDGDTIVSALEGEDYATAACEGFRPEIILRLESGVLAFESRGADLTFPPGQGGLDTLRIECRFGAALPENHGDLQVENRVYADRLGWSEIVATSQELAIRTALTATSPSVILTAYPDGPTREERSGSISFGPGEGSMGTVPSTTATSPPLVERIGRGVVAGSGAVALLAALALGAGHALAPGHGKTLIAAYLVGRRGGPRTAVGLGLSVALSHTLGVGLLGLVTALTTSAFQPESVYPWLSLISASIVTSIGAVMLIRAVRRDRKHHRHHPHDHDHAHEHDHHHPHHHEGDDVARPGWRSLAALGLAGGLVPSASAVVLLLGAVAQGEAWWGLLLVAGFGLGMSVSLIGAGLLAVGAQKWGWTRISSGRWRQTWQLRVPQFGGIAVTLIGLWLVFDAARGFVA